MAAQILAVELEQVEGDVQRGRLCTVAADKVKDREAAIVADDRLTVHDAGFRRQRSHGKLDEGEAVREVVAVSGNQPDAVSVPARDDPEPVVLDFVNPAWARRRLLRWSRQAWFDKAGRA